MENASNEVVREVLENQRWYPILVGVFVACLHECHACRIWRLGRVLLMASCWVCGGNGIGTIVEDDANSAGLVQGWSSHVKADDAPPWCTSTRLPCDSIHDHPELEWHIYKSEDYDVDGWLYSTSFDGEWGSVSRATVVRMRIWMGKARGDEEEYTAAAASSDAQAAEMAAVRGKDGGKPSPDRDDWRTLFPSGDERAQVKQERRPEPTAQDAAISAHPSSEACSLFGDSSNDVHREPGAFAPVEKHKGSHLLDRISAAARNVQKQTVVQTLKEASLFAFDHVQTATIAAVTAEPWMPAAAQLDTARKQDSMEVLSMRSKHLPDLSPVERSLVKCCASDIATFMSPPELSVAKTCQACGQEFGVTKFRYHCGYCGASFCRDDLTHSAILRAYGQSAPSKICANCHAVLTQKLELQVTQWRLERVQDYLNDKLAPYFDTTSDTAVDKMLRAATGTLAAAKAVPIGATAKMAVVSADFLRKYGRAGLLGFILRNEFMQSFATLKALIGDLDGLAFQDAAIGTYYFMAMNRGDRGANPTKERDAHIGCQPISDDLLAEMLKYAPLALHAIYEADVLDLQRLSRHQGFTVVYAHVQRHNVRHPSFALLGNRETKTALLLVRGSKSVQDLLTDIKAHPEEMSLPEATSVAVTDEEVLATTSGGFVDAFAHDGMLQAASWIKDRIVDSLRPLHKQGYQLVFAGHSLGAGCASLLAIMLQKEFVGLQCYAYAVPACVTASIADSCAAFVHSIVLRDDFVPRAKSSNIMKLVSELIEFKGCWRDTASEDLEAFKARAKTLWAPRKREWAKQTAEQQKFKQATPSHQSEEAKEIEIEPSHVGVARPAEHVSTWTLTRNNLVDAMRKTTGTTTASGLTELEHKPATIETTSAIPRQVAVVDTRKELYLPGTVTHLYYCQGLYEAVHVDRSCDALAHIPVFQNMLSDHLGRNYLTALRTVRDVRRLRPQVPDWIPFGTKTRCMCCDSPFTWNSTSSSEAQQNRDQHNCGKCGWLVCDGCSTQRKPIPEFGIQTPVRICDRCAFVA